MPISSKPVHCCMHVSRVFLFFGWAVALYCTYVRTSYVSRDLVSYVVSAYLVSYCLLVRQQQRFYHPTLKPTPTRPSAASGLHRCIHVSRVFCFFLVGMLPFIVRAYLVCVAYKNENIKREKKKGVPGFELATYRHAHQKQTCTWYTAVYMCRVFFFLLGCCPLLQARTSYVSLDPVSYQVYCKCVPGIIQSSRATTTAL